MERRDRVSGRSGSQNTFKPLLTSHKPQKVNYGHLSVNACNSMQ